MSYNIIIGSRADTSGIDRATSALNKADDAASEFVQSIKAGIGIDIGGKLVNSLQSIPGILQESISRGIEFNKSMMDSEIGIANVLGKFMSLNKEAAKAEASKAMQKIIELEPKTAAGLQDLVQGFLATVASAQSAGVSVEDNIDLVGRFANALANANIPAEQLSQELRAIFTENITPDAALAKVLQITNEDIRKAKEAGNLYEFLVGQIGTIGEAGDSASVRLSTLNSAIDKMLGEITKPIFDVWIEGLTDLTEAAGSDQEALRKLGEEIAQLVKLGYDFTTFLSRNTDLVVAGAKGVGLLVAAWTAYKIADIIAGLAGKTRALLANTTALSAETAALGANTIAQKSNAAARAAVVKVGNQYKVIPPEAPVGPLGKMGRGIRGAINSPTGAVLAGGAAIEGAVQVGLSLADLQAGLIAGGKSSRGDLEAASAMRDANAEKIQGLAERVRGVTTQEEKAQLQQELTKLVQDAISQQRDAGFLEEGRTAQNQALSDFAQNVSTLAQILSGKSGLLTADEVTAKAQKEKEEADRKKRLTDNAEILKEASQRGYDRGRDKSAAASLGEARAMMDAGKTDEALAKLNELQDFYKQWLDQTVIDPATMTEDELKSALDLREQLQGYLDDIAAARKDLPEAIAEAEQNSKEEQKKALQEQIDLIEAQGKKRIADLEASKRTEEEIARARLQIEEEVARKRLGIENQIGSLEGESSVARQAREISALADSRMRRNSFGESMFDRPDPIRDTAGGDLFADSRRRRGSVTSDLFERGIDASTSLFDSYMANRDRAVGERGGRSILGNDPTGSGSAPESDAAQSADQLASTIEKTLGEVSTKLEEAKESFDTAAVESAVGNLANAVKKAISRLESKIESAAKQI